MLVAFEESIDENTSAFKSVKSLVWVDVDNNGVEFVARRPREGLGWLEYESCFARQEGAEVDISALRRLTMADQDSINDGYHMYYTSGTTGKPKGVVLSHKIVVHHAVGITQGKSTSNVK